MPALQVPTPTRRPGGGGAAPPAGRQATGPGSSPPPPPRAQAASAKHRGRRSQPRPSRGASERPALQPKAGSCPGQREWAPQPQTLRRSGRRSAAMAELDRLDARPTALPARPGLPFRARRVSARCPLARRPSSSRLLLLLLLPGPAGFLPPHPQPVRNQAGQGPGEAVRGGGQGLLGGEGGIGISSHPGARAPPEPRGKTTRRRAPTFPAPRCELPRPAGAGRGRSGGRPGEWQPIKRSAGRARLFPAARARTEPQGVAASPRRESAQVGLAEAPALLSGPSRPGGSPEDEPRQARSSPAGQCGGGGSRGGVRRLLLRGAPPALRDWPPGLLAGGAPGASPSAAPRIARRPPWLRRARGLTGPA